MPLPAYEPPLAKTDFQHVRTTAYTHTEADHRAYSNRNALGGELHAAGPPIHRAEAVARATLAYEVPRAIPVDESGSQFATTSTVLNGRQANGHEHVKTRDENEPAA